MRQDRRGLDSIEIPNLRNRAGLERQQLAERVGVFANGLVTGANPGMGGGALWLAADAEMELGRKPAMLRQRPARQGLVQTAATRHPACDASNCGHQVGHGCDVCCAGRIGRRRLQGALHPRLYRRAVAEPVEQQQEAKVVGHVLSLASGRMGRGSLSGVGDVEARSILTTALYGK